MGYFWITVGNNDIEKLARDCKQLETLIFYKCLNTEGERLMLCRDIELQVLKSLKNLKQLVIVDRFMRRPQNSARHEFSNIIKVLNELKLKEIVLNVDISLDFSNMDKQELNKDNFKHYKSFSIGPFYEFSNIQSKFLNNFENLCNLTLTQLRFFKEFFFIILKNCKHLTHLTFYECTFHNFIALTDLKEIYFYNCYSLTWQNLRTILSEMNLESFTSLSTNYTKDFVVFPFALTLRKFHFYEYHNKEILNLLEFNKHKLKQLVEFQWDVSKSRHYKLNILKECENLKVLCSTAEQMVLKDCFKMKFLEKIIITTGGFMTATDVRLLLMQENLKELTIDMNFSCDVNIDLNDLLPFHTKLRYLNVNWRLLGVLYNFILDLLELNKQLTLKCTRVRSSESLIKLLKLPKFPTRFKDINLCGYRIDCLSLRNETPETVQLANFLIKTFHRYFWDMYIIMP